MIFKRKLMTPIDAIEYAAQNHNGRCWTAGMLNRLTPQVLADIETLEPRERCEFAARLAEILVTDQRHTDKLKRAERAKAKAKADATAGTPEEIKPRFTDAMDYAIEQARKSADNGR